jgi:hypothetical protein
MVVWVVARNRRPRVRGGNQETTAQAQEDKVLNQGSDSKLEKETVLQPAVARRGTLKNWFLRFPPSSDSGGHLDSKWY